MKLSYKNTAVVKFLEEKNLNNVFIEPDITVSKTLINDTWQAYSPFFAQSIDVITEPFFNAMLFAQDKLEPLVSDANKQLIYPENTSGTTIINGRAICYHFEEENAIVYIFEETFLCDFFFLSSTDKKEFHTVAYDEDRFARHLSFLAFFLVFKKHAEVEVKHLLPGKKIKDFKCKYLNDTRSDINVFDSKWFTTLVKSDGFKVRGHFRLQPCGEELKERKLIWINDFEKSGYTSRAKILNQKDLNLNTNNL